LKKKLFFNLNEIETTNTKKIKNNSNSPNNVGYSNMKNMEYGKRPRYSPEQYNNDWNALNLEEK
jgi:hypothetical protein